MNNFKLLLLLILILAPFINADAQKYKGIILCLGNKYHHNVYVDDLKWGREEPDTDFREIGIKGTLFFRQEKSSCNFFHNFFTKNLEINLSLSFLKVNNVFIAGGIWTFNKTIVGLSAGKVIPAKLKIPLTSKKIKKKRKKEEQTNENEDETECPEDKKKYLEMELDFIGGFYTGIHINGKFKFIRDNSDGNVRKVLRIGTGIYTGIRLRLKIGTKTQGAVGYRWYFPFNDFQYNTETDVAYRLHRRVFYVGIYWR